MTCAVALRQKARVLDSLRSVDDARLAESDIGPTVEVTLSDRTMLPAPVTDTARALGLRVDMHRSGTREDSLTVVLR